MNRPLPSHPSFQQLRNQAKDLLKARPLGDKSACNRLRFLHRFAKSSDAEILSAPLKLNEAQYALALSYGFESWNALRKHVEKASRGEIPYLTTLRWFAYTATDSAGKTHEGRVEGQDIEDALVRLRVQGLLATSMKPEGLKPDESLFMAQGPKARAEIAVTMILMQALADGDTEVVFERTPEGVKAESFFLNRRSPKVPLDEALWKDALDFLRDISGQPKLGVGTVRARRQVTPGQGFPGLGPTDAMDLVFRSVKTRPDAVRIQIYLPGSNGVIRATMKQIVARIHRAHRKGEMIHVLVNGPKEAERMASVISDTVGADEVKLISRGSVEHYAPTAPIEVFELSEACFTYIRAQLHGAEARDALREALRKTSAFCVSLIKEENLAPCQISGPGGVLLGTVTPRHFLTFYRKVTELQEIQG